MSPASLRLVVRAAATREIADQAKYYRSEASAALAARWRTAANEAIRSLRTFPERGSMVDPEDPHLRGIRRLPIQGFPKHFIFYHVDVVVGIVTIIHMLHGARDLKPILRAGGES